MARRKKSELNDNNLSIAYYRFSSYSQNEASIDQQRELAHDWAAAHGFRIAKKYVVDPDTAPFVQRMFADYAAGKPMKQICEELDAQAIRTTRGAKFGVKTLNKMLKNRAYIGEYRPATSRWMAACHPG